MAVSTHLQIDLNEYDARIRTFIPHYEEMLDTAAASLAAAARRPIDTVVDLGIGTGALAGRVASLRKRARVIGIDEDEGMLTMAGRRLPRGRATLVHDNFVSAPLPRTDAVTASIALHHIELPRTKKGLYRRIKQALGRGGVMVTADCHPPTHALLAAAGRSAWRDHLAVTYGRRKAEGFLRAWSHEDFYTPLEAELALMRAAGLSPEVTWRRGLFAVIVGVA